MRRLSLGLAALVLMGVGACGGDEPAPPEEATEAAEASDAVVEAPATAAGDEASDAAASEIDLSDTEAVLAAPGAPAFAVLYPGGTIQEPEAEAGDPAGPSGAVTYLTTASPDEVMAFHRARAEAEGLASVMAMNQGESRAYGAHSTENGANLSVFATPGEDGGASVQLVWSAGG
ncbi:MAG: hypothetical protein ACI8U3_002917 [Brevundimonas sp.]|jgi:hypothetical protein|uniref:hypothetical protein n=1 Tax=Brevundimonas sp. TaxID=1871086 RepID=UPI0039E554EB